MEYECKKREAWSQRTSKDFAAVTLAISIMSGCEKRETWGG